MLKKNRFQMIVVILILLPALWITYNALSSDLGLAVELSDAGISISHKGSKPLMGAESFTLTYEQVDEWEVLSEFPSMRKVWGFNSRKARVGDFKNDDLGQVKAYVLDVSRPQVVLRTAERTYIVTPDNVDSFVAQLAAATGR